MTRQKFFQLVNALLIILDDVEVTPMDIPNLMDAVKIVLQQERKAGTVVVQQLSTSTPGIL